MIRSTRGHVTFIQPQLRVRVADFGDSL